jgi:hypothetical protein
MLTALALVPSGAHLAALPNKMAMAQAPYFVAQQIYCSFFAWLERHGIGGAGANQLIAQAHPSWSANRFCRQAVEIIPQKAMPNPEIYQMALFWCKFLMHNVGMIFGYARVSTDARDLTSQLVQLKAAGCEKMFREAGRDGGGYDLEVSHSSTSSSARDIAGALPQLRGVLRV